jgi:hypothetical protein
MAFALPTNVHGAKSLLAFLLLRHHDGAAEGEFDPMRLEPGQIWRCINQACVAEIRVMESSGLTGGSNLRCTCGSLMKMPYSKPQLRRFEAPEEVKRLLQQLSVVLR